MTEEEGKDLEEGQDMEPGEERPDSEGKQIEERHDQTMEHMSDDLLAILEAKKHKAAEDAAAMLEAAQMLHDEMVNEKAEIEKLRERQVSKKLPVSPSVNA